MHSTALRRAIAAIGLGLVGGLVAPVSGISGTDAIQVFAEVDDALARAYPDADRIEREQISITAALREALEARLKRPFPFSTVRVHRPLRGDTPLGRAVVTEEIGRYRPMTFLVALDPEDAVVHVELLVFRESYGDEVRGAGFMGQFPGKTRADPIRVGNDIDSITGATLSARAISRGVKRMLYFFEVLDAHRAASDEPGDGEPPSGG